jgi:DNA-binding transcriptional MerR regulator
MADKELVIELQQIKRLMVILCTKDLAQKEQIRLLSRAGFQPKEIAELIGTTSNTVSVVLNSLKKTEIKKVKNGKQNSQK